MSALSNPAPTSRSAQESATGQWVTISGLASYESGHYEVPGLARFPSNARAGALGRYRVSFRVGTRRGTHAITATGQFAGRTATTTFWVVRRR